MLFLLGNFISGEYDMPNETLSDPEPRRFRGLVYISIFFTVVICVLAAILIPSALGFGDLDISGLVILLFYLFFISLVIERSIEAILNAWRRRGKQTRKELLKQIKKRIEVEKDDQAKKDLRQQEEKSSQNLSVYTSVNRTLALLMGLAMGIAVSALGFRILQPLVDPVSLQSTTSIHHKFFGGVDTLITGALIGGGSNGVHRILDAVLSYADKISTKNKEEEAKIQ